MDIKSIYSKKTFKELNNIIRRNTKPLNKSISNFEELNKVKPTNKNSEKFTDGVKAKFMPAATKKRGATSAEISAFVKKNPEEHFKRVDRWVGKYHIIYEGATVDIDDCGRMFPKQGLRLRKPEKCTISEPKRMRSH